MSQPLVDKYRPQTLNDIQGNNSVIDKLKEWASGWDRDPPQMFEGPPGVGKTTAAQCLANDYNWELEEINASDARKSDDIEDIVDRMKVKPIEKPHQLILLDEVDSIPGRTRLGQLKEVLENPPNPIVVSCNEKWNVPNEISSPCTEHSFSLSVASRRARIKKIANAEDLDLGAATIGQLAERENLRDAIQDLQAYMRDGATGQVDDDGRTYAASPFEFLDDLRTGKDDLPRTEESPEDIQRWIEHGLRGRYEDLEAQVVWDVLSRSAKWLDRARQFDYRYWRHASLLQESLADIRLKDPYGGYVSYGTPDYVRPQSPTSESNNDAALFRELSNLENGRPGIMCNFEEFKQIYLPMLKDLHLEERRQMAVEHGLSDSAKKALGLDPDQFEEWAIDQGAKIEESSVFDW